MNKTSPLRVVATVCGLWAALCSWGPLAQADFTYGPATPIPNVSRPGAGSPQISRDGLELYFAYNAASERHDLWVARRATTRDLWDTPVRVEPPIHAHAWVGGMSLSNDGLEMYLGEGHPQHWTGGYGPDPNGYGNGDLWVVRRPTKSDPWGKAVNLGPTINTASWDDHPCLSADGLTLYFASARSAPATLYATTRATRGSPWGQPAKLGAPIDMPGLPESTPFISADGLSLYFNHGLDRPDIYVSTRSSAGAPWGPPTPFTCVNTASAEYCLSFSEEDSTLYFTRGDSFYGIFDLWQVKVLPVLDLNNDGKVDERDLEILVADWGKSNSVCDIGPFAWGDGVVDEKDLGVLMEHLITPGPRTSDVPCDAVLSWIAPRTAKSDVYLGASREAVTNASRVDPQEVLVSQGQTAITYAPAGPLDYSRTYYWRVDFVGAGLNPTIYKGPVLDFTTEPFAYPLKNVTATASNSQLGMGPERTVDGSGLDKNDGHSAEPTDMWLSAGAQPAWVQYQFDKVYALHELWVWNSNQRIEPFLGFGAKTVKIEYSTDGTKWTQLAGVPEFARAPGAAGYSPGTFVSFGGVSAKFVKLTIEKGWGSTPSVGLSEVRFFYIPDRSATKS